MRTARCAAAALLALAEACAADLVSYSRAKNLVRLELDAGAAEIEWITPSTFRLRQSFAGRLPEIQRPERLGVKLEVDDAPGQLVFTTRYVRVSVRKRGLLVRATKLDGTRVFEDLQAPEYTNGAVTLVRAAEWGAALYGLGPRADNALNARGKVVRAGVPFLYSTEGYGEYYATPAAYTFDMAHSDRYRVEARGAGLLDYYFCFGPTPKETFEELQLAGIAVVPPAPAPVEPSWQGLRNALARVLHGSFSGILAPEFDEAAFRGAPPDLRERARQLAAVVKPGLRREFDAYFVAYRQEARDRGAPPLRALPFQFPADAEAAKHGDEFMFGDELLAAPILTAEGRRSVYLPMGIWTRLDTNEVFKGRQTIAVESRELPLFARNGTIVPLARAAMELHYFPRLGAEFFLFEDDSGEYSQMHAAPAADIMRLEIESARAREYEWVVHHVERPLSVSFEERVFREAKDPGALAHETWHWNAARRNLHVRVRVAAGEDRIVNVAFQSAGT